jgi:hypothetical protein
MLQALLQYPTSIEPVNSNLPSSLTPTGRYSAHADLSDREKIDWVRGCAIASA